MLIDRSHSVRLPIVVALLAMFLIPGVVAAQQFADDGVETWTEQGAFAFEPTDQVAGGPLDLRPLNEDEAGQHGFVRRSDAGDGFVRGDGEPIRFWGVGVHAGPRVSDAELARHARFLAKIGVNMVRIGGASPGLIPQAEGAAITDVNREFVDQIWRTVAAMKQEGIYVRIGPFWDHGSVKYINADWGIEGYQSGDRLNPLLFFDPTLQKGYRAWMKYLLTEPNPYTGIPLKDDPALALFQIVSEDSMLFWWTNDIKGGPLKHLQSLFGEFAKDKYGSIDAALDAWDGATVEGDAPDAGRLGFYNLHHLVEWPAPGNPQRVDDQTEFLGRLERDFYVEMTRYLREELGAKQVIGPSNFHSADDARLDDLQRWTWTACDVIELNDFFGVTTQGRHAFWRINAGHFFTRRSAVHDPAIPPAKKQVAGMPFIISSTNWTPPNLYRAEGPIINAAYGAMNGMDGFLHLGASAPTYNTSPYMTWTTIQGSHPMFRWTCSEPGFLSQFPAAALIFRQGLIDPAETVVHEQRSLAELFDRRPPLLTDELGYDPAAHAGQALPVKQPLMRKADPRALLVGRVEAAYDADPAGSRVTDVAPYIDQRTGAIRTTHGQLEMNPKRGLLTLNAPRAQGVVGFLAEAGGSFATADLTIRSGNRYAVVLAVSMDGRPLSESGRVLVQYGSTARPTGWSVQPATRKVKGEDTPGVELLDTGRMPWRMSEADVTLTLRNPNLTQARKLDPMGHDAGDVALEQANGAVTLALPADAVYTILSAD